MRGEGVPTRRGNLARFSRDYWPPAEAEGAVSRTWPAIRSSSRHLSERAANASGSPLATNDGKRGLREGVRRERVWPQRIGGLLIAVICVFTVVWYVPRVIGSDRRLLTGTVASNGVVTLNFTNAGQIKQINVRLGQRVRKGEVLAVEYAPDADAAVAADKASIAYDLARITQLRADQAVYPAAAELDGAQIAANQAQLRLEAAQLTADRLRVTAAEIVAPSAGTVVGANGQPGQTATSTGVRDYVAGSQQPGGSQQPAFSLVPEGPQPVRRPSASEYPLPVIALRSSTTWRVIALVPEGSVSGIRSGRGVAISVPAAHIADVRGKIAEVLPTPVPTSVGTAYEAVVSVTGHATTPPLNGMAADIQLFGS